MAGKPLTEISIVPVLVFLLPVLAGVFVFSMRRISRAFQQWISIVTAALVTGLGAWMARQILHGVILTSWNNELRVDGLSALMVLVISGIALLATIYSVRSLAENGGATMTDARSRRFYGLLMWFLGTML